MPYKEKDIEKLYYTIGEVSIMFGVSASLLRFWESEFDTIKPKKNKKGNRLFSKKDIESIRIIYHLVKEKGFTLTGAKEHIKSGKNAIESKIEVIQSLKEIRSFLEELKSSL